MTLLLPRIYESLENVNTDASSFSSIRDGVSRGVVAFNSISFNAGRNCEVDVPLHGRKIASTSGSMPWATRSMFALWKSVKNVRHEEGSLELL
jgi:hypothetical protein